MPYAADVREYFGSGEELRRRQMTRCLLLFALLLLVAPATADDAQEKALIQEAVEGWAKVASDDYGDYYVDREGIFRHPGYVLAGYAVALRHPDERGYFLMGTYKFNCRGQAQMTDADYFHTSPPAFSGGSPYLGTSGESERPDSSMKKIDDPSVAAMEKYACK